MIILQFFHISTKGCLGGDHKHMSLDFRDQTGPVLRKYNVNGTSLKSLSLV